MSETKTIPADEHPVQHVKLIKHGEWEQISEQDSDGGFMERRRAHTCWLVRYRNPDGRILSPFVVVVDDTNQWTNPDLSAEWIMMDTTDAKDTTWMERFPVYNGWFIGHGNTQKRNFSHAAFFHDPRHKWED